MLELAGIIILGILAQWVAWRFKIPAILPLILIGLLVGPIAAEFFNDDGSKWIEPIWDGEKGLFPGEGLYYFVSLSISIILFEGGLTLRRGEIKNIGPVITKLITLGSAVTFFGGAIIAHYVFGLSWELSFLFSGLIIVTGPTVITPILRNIPLKKDVSAVLKWEGILIDPIGALVAVLVFEFISVGGGAGFTGTALLEFLKIILFGTTFGFTFAHALIFVINKKWVPHYLLNVVSLSTVLLVFVESELFAHESGLLAVVVMGMVLGNSKLKNLKEILYFKESLSVLLISILFILLSANIDYKELTLLYEWKTLLLFALIVFVIRPLAVFLSTSKSNLKTNEKLFISWVGPRGIVAAGIASLFGSKLLKQGIEGAEYITPLVFMVVLGTVLLNATTARLFAKLVGVFLKRSNAIMIVGASDLARMIAKYLKQNQRRVVLIDSNIENVEKAKEEGLESIEVNIYDDQLTDNIELNDVGYLIAMTGSDSINKFVISNFSSIFGEQGAYRLATSQEVITKDYEDEDHLFTIEDDYINLMEAVREFPEIHETVVNSIDDYKKKIEEINRDQKSIPIFVKSQKNEILLISEFEKKVKKIEDWKLVYVGKNLNI
ncbi:MULTISPECIES: cation:proton antiporter [Tenacibaculum]|uniref:Cell shape-determining protein n=2 Tax=Tenacibaculum TaxID=104267 RepID=A0AAE9MMB1_9FLAO|nr:MULTISPECIES: sodium:proton antiporter [Tenacibaculum]GFD75166.1 sodium:proton antiporter [Tenacibaculum sp. KUL113]GFD96710.1 sodium:proton antiporter [Alteromonas sp. KUL154]GFE00651.1 sodium:proton antiporter [Alteromonas sp. KUL156]AZJ31519.1 cell shape-determining protein [Tenacibaculum mesophilum]MCG7502526.1 cation:proton antiporter [Tenacibaculum sp. Mcav3-52]